MPRFNWQSAIAQLLINRGISSGAMVSEIG